MQDTLERRINPLWILVLILQLSFLLLLALDERILKQVGILLLAGTVVALILFRPMVGLVLAIGTIPFYISLPGVSGVMVTRILGLFTAFSCGLTLLAKDRTLPKLSWQEIMLALFAASTIVSLLFSSDFAASISWVSRYVSSFVLYLITVYLIRSIGRIKYIIWILILSVSLAALLGTIQLFVEGFYRMGGFIQNPNYFAYVLVSVLPLTVLLISESTGKLKILLAFCLFALLVGIIATFSRGGLIALFAVSFVLLIRHVRKKAAVLLAAAGVIVVVLIFIGSEVLPQLHYAELLGYKRMISVYYRTLILKGGLKMFFDYPFFGVGVGNFMNTFAKYSPLPRSLSHPMAHNSYLEVACETGFLGLLFFLGIIAITIVHFERSRRKFKTMKHSFLLRITEGLEIGFVGYLVAHFFASAQYAKHFWLLIALSAVLVRLDDSRLER